MNKRKSLINYLWADVEILEENIVLNEKKPDETAMRVKLKFQQSDIINTNGRRYRREILQPEIDRVSPLAKEGKIFAGKFHPESGVLETSEVAGMWESGSIKEDGSCVGIAKILPTTQGGGKDIQVIIRAGGKIGVSSRGWGTVTQKTEDVDGEEKTFMDVNDDFKLATFGDFVTSPSVEDAGIIQVMEQKFDEFCSCNQEKIVEEEILEKEKEKEVVKIDNADALKKEYPEFTKEIEDAKVKATEEAKKAKAEEDEQKLKDKIMAEIQPKLDKIDELEKVQKDSAEAIREAITTLSEIPGVIPEEFKKEGDKKADESAIKPAEENTEEADKVKADLKSAEEKIADLEKKDKEREDAEAEAKKQEGLAKALDSELEKEENKEYAKMIKTELTEENKVLVEGAEKIPEAIKAAKDKISNMLVRAQRADIVADTEEKGHVENPDKTKEEELTEESISQRYAGAVRAGYKGTLDEFKSGYLGIK